MKNIKSWLLALALTTGSWSVLAAPITMSIGDVEVNGTIYGLSILYDDAGVSSNQSFNALMPEITFTSQADATSAINAIMAAYPIFDWTPADANSSGLRIAYEMTVDDYSYMTISENNGPFGPFTFSRDSANVFSFAQFDLANPVSAPSSIIFLGLGLFLARFGRKSAL